MFNKRGKLNSRWKGGITPLRQWFYETPEWKAVAKFVKKRDGNRCARCGHCKGWRESMHIHHIVSFQVEELRLEPINLVLLCKKCHNFVHSKENVNKEFIQERG